MRGRAATYTLRSTVVGVRGVITVMPFSLLWVRTSIVGDRGQNGRIETFAVRSMNQSAPIAIATAEPPPMTTRE